MPTVDAMMLVDRDNLQLCLNEFSPRLDAFRESDLCKRLSDAVVDSVRLLADSSIITLHSDVSRKNEDAVLDELFRQTGIRYNYLSRASVCRERGGERQLEFPDLGDGITIATP